MGKRQHTPLAGEVSTASALTETTRAPNAESPTATTRVLPPELRIAVPALEGLVAQHLRAWIAYGNRDAKLYYWRTRSGVEVDFIIYGDAGFWAVEVKNATRVRPEDLGGLKSLPADYPECEPLLLYRGRERLKIERIHCLPVDEFLRDLNPLNQSIASN